MEAITKLTGGKGVDVAIEAVGVPDTFQICQAIIGPGGHIANIGVHGKSVELHLEKLWDRNITITTRLVDTVTIPMLMKTVLAGKLKLAQLITHRFPLCEVLQAYEVFQRCKESRAQGDPQQRLKPAVHWDEECHFIDSAESGGI